MILANRDLESLIQGAIRFRETESGVMPLRFTEEQDAHYRRFPNFFDKVFASCGMRMDFLTDATEMTVQYSTVSGSSRKFCHFDVYLDGVLVQHCGTDDRELHPDGVLSLKTDGQEHRITVYLPNLAGVEFHRMELQSATYFKPVKRAEKMLVFGDSITQGYDAHYPSFSYINRVADHFNLEIVNKAVGGDFFSAEMGAYKEDFTPARIFVAYGTNDWSHKQRDTYENDVRAFFRELRGRFPATPIHVLLPIWREDSNRETFVGTFEYARDFIRKTCGQYDRIQVIDGMPIIPHLPQFFEDFYLHPNDLGNLLMSAEICRALEKEMKE